MVSIDFAGFVLMPLTQAVSWYLILFRSEGMSLFDCVWKVAAFYCGWALVNKYVAGRDEELGYFPFGLLAIMSFLRFRLGSLVATFIVWAFFVAAMYFLFSAFDSQEAIAIEFKGNSGRLSIAWVYTLQAYGFSNVLLWLTVFYKFARMRRGMCQCGIREHPTEQTSYSRTSSSKQQSRESN